LLVPLEGVFTLCFSALGGGTTEKKKESSIFIFYFLTELHTPIFINHGKNWSQISNTQDLGTLCSLVTISRIHVGVSSNYHTSSTKLTAADCCFCKNMGCCIILSRKIDGQKKRIGKPSTPAGYIQ
jgi:hypothetical protein